jgi:phosphatidylserine/phosphatidylglycerophosphate/cardiolipin synthase-like enzyme
VLSLPVLGLKGSEMGELKQASFRLFTLTVLTIIFLLVPSIQAADIILPQDTPVQVFFSPNGGCKNAIINTIGKAKSEILVQAYIFTSEPIAKALLEAHKRGVKVFVILDKSQKKNGYSPVTFFANQGIPAYIDSTHAIAHDKLMIIDRETIITGSFNFTKSAENQNAENLLIIKSSELAGLYRENWMKHKAHSEKQEAMN